MKQPKFQKWYNWPEYYLNAELRPWYVLVRIAVFLPLVLTSYTLSYLSLVLMDGIPTAEDFRKNL